MWFDSWFRLRKSLVSTYCHIEEVSPVASHCARFSVRSAVKLIDKRARLAKTRYLEKCSSNESCSFKSFCSLSEEVAPYRPLVSVIVPNYNHYRFLSQRLDSIYEQSYQNFEVILLDDCSTDSSRELLEEYAKLYPERTRLVLNESNSGGVFYQWERGLSLAAGDLIWIAESDDFCSDNFLEHLVNYFYDEAVTLAYSRTVFVDEVQSDPIWTLEEYLSGIDADLWGSPFVMTAHEAVDRAWALKNIVPNASGAIFRKPRNLDLLTDNAWKSMSICGDWIFYLHVISGGLVAYTDSATNYYRIHSHNTSVSTYSRDVYYEEHELVARYVNTNYKVSDHLFERQRDNLAVHWKQHRPELSEEELSRCYDVAHISDVKASRKPSILMVGYSFSAGGGETFPIQLANILKSRGYHVTYLSCEQEPREKGVRDMLRDDIPVVTNFLHLGEIVRRFGVDIVHSHHAWVDNTVKDLLPKDASAKTVVSLHGMYEMVSSSDLKKVLPSLVKRTAAFVYAADKNIKPFKESGFYEAGHFNKIDNALSITSIDPVSRIDLGVSSNAFVLCLVSRAIPEKGWKEAIRIVGKARELSGADVQLILIGEGPEYESISGVVPDYVQMLGFKKNIRDYYAASDVGFLPSRFSGESFPLTIIDSLFAGTPVLASDVGEISKMLCKDKRMAGHVFRLRDGAIPIDEVSEIIVRLVNDRAFYKDIKSSVPYVAAKFDLGVMCDQYEKVYRAIEQ